MLKSQGGCGMRKKNTLWAIVAGIALLGSSAAWAQETELTDLLSTVQQQQAELDALRLEIAGINTGGIAPKVSRHKQREVYVGYELTVLRPYISSANSRSSYGEGYGAGQRIVVGYQNCCGFGVRGRLWMFNHGVDMLAPQRPQEDSDSPTSQPRQRSLVLDMDAFDVEATLHERLRKWDLTLAGGVRYGRLGYGQGRRETFFEGVGPTVALEAQYDVGSRGLYLVGNGRASVLFGDIYGLSGGGGDLIRAPQDIIMGPGGNVITGETTCILENQLGIGWEKECGRGVLDLRCVWETQFWMNDTFADDANGIGSNFAFNGLTFASELRY